MLRRVFVVLAMALSAPAFAASQGGPIPVPLPLFPGNNWWNTDVSAAPVDANSAGFITHIGPSVPLHPDFGGNASPGFVYGFPFIIVDNNQALKTVTFSTPMESDGVDHNTNMSYPFYPIPDEAITMTGWIEDGPPGNVDDRGNSDRHMLIVNESNNTLYELFSVYYNGTNWVAGSGAFFDMNTNNRRPDMWTSADAAGLAMLPGLVRYDEVYGPNEITHAFRFTVRDSNGYVFPASHNAGSSMGALPMGARLRLKATKDISSFTPDIQKIFRAFKKYGLIVADNGTDMYISGTYDTNWNNDILNPAFGALTAGDFEVVQLGWKPVASFILTLPAAMGNGDAADATLRAYDTNYIVATGYTGTVHFSSTDGSATLPVNYTFTAGDAGTHTFAGGFTLRTAGGQTVYASDVADATITTSRNVVVGPPTPTGLSATATTMTHVDLSWNPSNGAAQYEIQRLSAASPYTTIAMVTAPTVTYPDTVTAGATYVYQVRAVDSSSRVSPFSTPDAATTMTFTDDPLVAGSTPVKAIHVTELQQAVNLMRAAAGIGTFGFTNINGMTVQAAHLQELRANLTAARVALHLPSILYTDPTLTTGSSPVKAIHFQELRTAVK